MMTMMTMKDDDLFPCEVQSCVWGDTSHQDLDDDVDDFCQDYFT